MGFRITHPPDLYEIFHINLWYVWHVCIRRSHQYLAASGPRSLRLNTLWCLHARVLHNWSSGYSRVLCFTSCVYIYDNGDVSALKVYMFIMFLQSWTLKIITICLDGTKLMWWLVCILFSGGPGLQWFCCNNVTQGNSVCFIDKFIET